VQLDLVKQLQVPVFSSYSVMGLCVSLLAIAGFVAVRRRGRA
jgi:LPXTG-motif cell wall-anchored protein